MNLGHAKLLDRILGGACGRVLGACDRLGEWLRTPAPVERVDHILVSKFWGLGNWALLRPVVLDLRARWPGARLTVATLEGNRDLVSDLADQLLVVRPRRLLSVSRDLSRAVHRLRTDPPDLALDFEQFARTGALLARLGGARQRVGFLTGERARDDLYTVLVPFRQDRHASRSFRDLAEAAGVAPGPYVPGALSPSEAGLAASAPYRAGGAYVVLHPGSGDNFKGRRWSTSGFAAAGRKALAHGHRVLITGSEGEARLARTVAASIPGARVVAGRLSVPALVAVLARATAVVSNDTGPVHIASALGVPVLAIYGPNTPALYGPLSPGSRAFYRDLPCSPCITTSNYRSSRCRIYSCMASIPTGEVAASLDRLLRRAVAETAASPEAPCVPPSP